MSLITYSTISFFVLSYHCCRLGAQIPDDRVVTFPVEFMSKIMTKPAKLTANEALQMHPNLLESHQLIFPVKTNLRLNEKYHVVVIINPFANVNADSQPMSEPAILSLIPFEADGTPTNICRRLRALLNQITGASNKGQTKISKVNNVNLKHFTPQGKYPLRTHPF